MYINARALAWAVAIIGVAMAERAGWIASGIAQILTFAMLGMAAVSLRRACSCLPRGGARA